VTAARYVYLDGNNNTYTITDDRLVYRPVAPAASSSGSYSGGEPATIDLVREQLVELDGLFAQVLADTANHVTDRAKGCGIVIRDDQPTICSPASRHLAALDAELRRLRTTTG